MFAKMQNTKYTYMQKQHKIAIDNYSHPHTPIPTHHIPHASHTHTYPNTPTHKTK